MKKKISVEKVEREIINKLYDLFEKGVIPKKIIVSFPLYDGMSNILKQIFIINQKPKIISVFLLPFYPNGCIEIETNYNLYGNKYEIIYDGVE
jgi:hypothetical protein